jgi:hypothetical protein
LHSQRSSNHLSDSTAEAQLPPTGKPDFVVTPDELMKQFAKDKTAAGKKYNEKLVEINGVLDDPHLGDPASNPYVSFKTEVGTLACFLDVADGARTNNWTVGQRIKLKGIINGEIGYPSVMVHDCEILEIGPEPALLVTAADLAKAYIEDPTAAEKRFSGKQLLVEGVVKRVILKGVDPYPNPLVILEGAIGKDGKSLCVWSDSHYARTKDFEKLQKGQKIKVKGNCGTVWGKKLIGEDGIIVSRVVIVK